MDRILIVSGSRAYDNFTVIMTQLSRLHARFRFTHLYHGDARGVDKLAHIWGEINALVVRKFPYLEQYGRAGGPRRNRQMLETALKLSERVILAAFPAEESVGTHDMIEISSPVIPVYVFEVTNDRKKKEVLGTSLLYTRLIVPKSGKYGLDGWGDLL